MKKITLALALLTYGVQAQDFPLPYCEITDANEVFVEEITSVDFAGTSISNTDSGLVLIDETANVVNITQDETYTMEVSGNTYGDFDNDIVAFIDWNQNNVLDDTGEIYEIGTPTNSTGSDGVSVSIAITVPADAVLGTTRIRITKTYQDVDSPAEINPCGIQFNPFEQGVFSGYGQALDFTLQIFTSLSTGEFDTNALTVYPMPTKDVLNVSYKSLIDSIKIYNLLGQEVYSKNTDSANLHLELASLTVGSYIVKLFSEQIQHSFKIIKQ
jgi:hypothetical protein